MPGRATGTDTELQGLISLANSGDSASREALLDHACTSVFACPASEAWTWAVLTLPFKRILASYVWLMATNAGFMAKADGIAGENNSKRPKQKSLLSRIFNLLVVHTDGDDNWLPEYPRR